MLVTTLAALGTIVVPHAASASDPLADAQAKVTSALRSADAAVAAYDSAQTKYYGLQQESDKTRRTIDQMRAQQHELALQATARAVVAYKGGDSSVIDDVFGATTDVMDAARRTTFLNRLNAHSNDAMRQLVVVTDQLHAREGTLRKQVDELGHRLKDLKTQADAATKSLDGAKAAEDALKTRLANEKRVAEFTALVAKARSAARPGGGGGAGQVIVQGSWPCPVQGPVSFHEDFGDPRSGGRGHKGTDMFSPRGTPVVAVTSGSVFFQGDPLGGNAAYVTGGGNTYYYAHLNDYVGGARSVSAGEVVGHVGNTGDASGGPTHLHFEIRVGGPNGTRIDPYPTLAAHC